MLKLWTDRNAWLVGIFAIYLGLIVVFSFIYFWIYQRNPRDFVFNAEIMETQHAVVMRRLSDEIRTYELQVGVLEELSGVLTGEAKPTLIVDADFLGIPGKVKIKGEFHKFEFYLAPVVFRRDPEAPPEPPVLRLVARDNTGAEVANVRLTARHQLPSTQLDIESAAQELRAEVRAQLQDARQRFSLLSVSPVRAWGYWDFLYFSTVTQTTVGYGDILPNSTLVRMVVATQILIGLGVLGVMINFVVRRRQA